MTLPLRKKQVEMGVELQQEFRLNCFKNLILGFSKIIEPVSYLTQTSLTRLRLKIFFSKIAQLDKAKQSLGLLLTGD